MEERIIAKSKQYDIKRVCITILICFTLLSLIVFYAADAWHPFYLFDRYFETKNKDYLRWAQEDLAESIVCSCLIGGFTALISYWWLSKTEMIISDKRVYGRTVFGKRVDLPLDSVSAVGSRWPKGITVATSSGRIAFLMVKNRNELHACISKLLIERQNQAAAAQMTSGSSIVELEKYADLLQRGYITQEEYNAAKKQILGL